MIESNLQPLPADVEALLAAERDVPVPVGVEQRVLARVEHTVAAPAAPAVAGAAWIKPLLAVVAALGIGGGAMYAVWSGGATPAAPVAVPDAPAEAERERDVPAIAVAGSEPRAQRAPAAPSDTLAAERALLDRAQTALVAGDAPAARRAVAEHLREFPRGRLVEEREALRVQVLARVGRTDVAARVAERFLARYPRSIHRGAVEAALEGAR